MGTARGTGVVYPTWSTGLKFNEPKFCERWFTRWDGIAYLGGITHLLEKNHPRQGRHAKGGNFVRLAVFPFGCCDLFVRAPAEHVLGLEVNPISVESFFFQYFSIITIWIFLTFVTLRLGLLMYSTRNRNYMDIATIYLGSV